MDILQMANLDIMFCWIPGRIGPSGHKDADISTKEALSLRQSGRFPWDVKPLVNFYMSVADGMGWI